MKTTIDLPDPLLREAKATAAKKGESLKELFTTALQNHLAASSSRKVQVGTEGWRRVVGTIPREVTAEVDAAIEEAFEQIDPGEWT